MTLIMAHRCRKYGGGHHIRLNKKLVTNGVNYLGLVDLCCMFLIKTYIGKHTINNASDNRLA